MVKRKYNPKYGSRRPAKADMHKLDSIPDFAENERFTKIYAELKHLCDFLKDKPQCLSDEEWEDKVQALKNYILIRLVNVIENQLKTETTQLIDEFEIHPADVLQVNEISFSIYELDVFRQPNTTNGKLVTQQYEFANVRKISKIFSNINKLKFFPWLEELFSNHPIQKEFEEILLKRNDVVHSLHDVEWTPSELQKKVQRVELLANIFFSVSWINIDRRPKWKKKVESECKDKFSFRKLTLDEFRKIAKKHEF